MRTLSHTPDLKPWQRTAPVWAKNLYTDIFDQMKAVAWNRELDWRVSGDSDAIWAAPTPVTGSLESTPGGQKIGERPVNHRIDTRVRTIWRCGGQLVREHQ